MFVGTLIIETAVRTIGEFQKPLSSFEFFWSF